MNVGKIEEPTLYIDPKNPTKPLYLNMFRGVGVPVRVID